MYTKEKVTQRGCYGISEWLSGPVQRFGVYKPAACGEFRFMGHLAVWKEQVEFMMVKEEVEKTHNDIEAQVHFTISYRVAQKFTWR